MVLTPSYESSSIDIENTNSMAYVWELFFAI